uniref:Uncharacterized protein n=1 Tax=Acrobeloides nanus TaxID=290746 RepID=A0A914CSS4_9BILA
MKLQCILLVIFVCAFVQIQAVDPVAFCCDGMHIGTMKCPDYCDSHRKKREINIDVDEETKHLKSKHQMDIFVHSKRSPHW